MKAILIMAGLLAFGCPLMPSQTFQALESYRQSEQVAFRMGTVTVEDNRFIVKRLDALDAVGKAFEACLGGSSHEVCRSQAVAPIDKVSTLAAMGIKDAKVRSDFTAVLVKLKSEVSSIP